MGLETLSSISEKISEIGDKFKENSFNPDKRLEATETSNMNEEESTYNPDQRIDTMDVNDTFNTDESYNPDNRLDIEDTETLDQLIDNYIEDLKGKAEYPELISRDSIKIEDLKIVDSETVGQLRTEFNNNRDNLRKEWESLNGKEWPTYSEDVCTEDGRIIRKEGDKFDAHHNEPLSMGGKNEATNITPIHVLNHYDHLGVHAIGAPLDQLKNAL